MGLPATSAVTPHGGRCSPPRPSGALPKLPQATWAAPVRRAKDFGGPRCRGLARPVARRTTTSPRNANRCTHVQVRGQRPEQRPVDTTGAEVLTCGDSQRQAGAERLGEGSHVGKRREWVGSGLHRHISVCLAHVAQHGSTRSLSTFQPAPRTAVLEVPEVTLIAWQGRGSLPPPLLAQPLPPLAATRAVPPPARPRVPCQAQTAVRKPEPSSCRMP